MSPATRSISAALVVVTLLALGPYLCAQDGAEGADDVMVSPWAPPDEQLIRMLPEEAGLWTDLARAQRMWEWVLWPSAEYVAAHPVRDRTAEFPPVYASPEHERARYKPLVYGATRPDVVRREVADWVVRTVAKEALPEDTAGLADSVVLVPEAEPAMSKACLRVVTDSGNSGDTIRNSSVEYRL